jgi:hypothetical protein
VSKRALIVCVCLVILGGALVWALPEIIRQVALDQIPKRTGRAVAIADIDLNLFTGRLAIKKFRLAERNRPEAFVEIERLDARIATTALLRRDIRLTELGLLSPSIRMVRTGAGEFNFSDLLKSDKPASGLSRWTVTLDRLTIADGAIHARDEVISPATEWVVQDLGVDVAGITTRRGATPGRGTLHAKIDEAMLDVTAEPLRLYPPKSNVKVTLDGFETRRVGPYIYAATPYRPRGARLALALEATVDQDGDELTKAAVSGTVNIDRELVTWVGKPDPFLGVSRVAVEVREADAIRRTLSVASVAIDGLDLKVRRDGNGVIDVVELFTQKAPAAGAPPAAATPPVESRLFPVLRALSRGFEQIVVDRITLTPSTAMFVDASVKPMTKLELTKLQATVTDLTWPPKGPANLALSTGMPGGGTLDINGPVVPKPLDADLVVKLRDAPVEPYQAYIPVPAQLSGRVSGDSRNRIVLKDGQTVLASKGNSWAQNIAIRASGQSRPAIRVERADLVGIDFDWPKRAAVAKAGFRRLAVEVEREADGSFDLVKMFEAPSASPGPRDDKPKSPPPKNLLETMRLDFKQVRIEDGSVRFLDRTTTPPVSQDMSRLEVTATNINNRPGERGQLAVQSVIGRDASLDVRGDVGSIGSPAFIDLVGELRSFKLPSVDPYATAATGWGIKKGELQYKVHFKLDGDALDATNDVVVGKLQVAPASGTDEVKRRIGLPLGLLVSLVKDSRGEIHANVPITGSIQDPTFHLGDAIWTAIKNVLTNIVKAPFRAIGRLFSHGDKTDEDKTGTTDELGEPKVAPITFAAGSAVIAPDMEKHLGGVADFLRRTPFVNLALSPAPSAADTEALKAEAVNARLREFQKARGLKDGPKVSKAYFKAQLPEVKPPKTVAERLAMLREREPAPEGALDDLDRRRIDVTRERLVSAEGIPAERLTVAEAPAAVSTPPAPNGAGRVEFQVEARAD